MSTEIKCILIMCFPKIMNVLFTDMSMLLYPIFKYVPVFLNFFAQLNQNIIIIWNMMQEKKWCGPG